MSLQARAVEQIDPATGEATEAFPSVYAAARSFIVGQTGTIMTAIVNCCQGRQKTAYGYRWRYQIKN